MADFDDLSAAFALLFLDEEEDEGVQPQIVQNFIAHTGIGANLDPLPFRIRQGQVPEDQLNRLLQIWLQEMNTQVNPLQDFPFWQGHNPGQNDYFYQFNPALVIGAQAEQYGRQMPAEARAYHQNFLQLNQALIDRLTQHCGDITFTSQNEERYVWSHRNMGQTRADLDAGQPRTPVNECVFNLPCLQKRWHGGSNVWHVDGGSSLLFLAITLQGERILEFKHNDENGNPVIQQVHSTPGHFYISSPAVFWHRVLPAPNRPAPNTCTTLIFRSSVLLRRISGGRERENGRRTNGMRYATRAAFRNIVPRIAEIFREHEVVWQ
ncbi:MAG: hypothetical protein ACR2ON_03255 [Paracoccaceae bacterium]